MIVGIGASAGGLQAFTELLRALPSEPGFAIVLVQHLSPDHESEMPALLQKQTLLPVTQVSDGTAIEANHVYVIPPNVQMGVSDTRLFLTPRPGGRSQYTPIDFFFASLAHAAQDRAIGVILSGTASDGAAGIREIKAAGGLTIAQRPSTARYDGMPRAAIGTGQVDLVLGPAEIARKLVNAAAQPPLPGDRSRRDGELPVSAEQLDAICTLLLPASGIDFTQYKSPTIRRRLQRRMALHRMTSTDAYIALLEQNPDEVTNLYHDILIHVTRFFRDQSSYTALAADVFPEIFEERLNDQPVRVWVSGCATGEEAYSLAIEMVDYLGERGHGTRIQIFATDVSDAAIEHARNGLYPADIAADVPADRLRRYFTRVDGGYRVSKALRDLCVFARQDLTRDPPFSRLDLIFCRNVLIYMSAALQQRLMSIFHYALRPNGFLVLGQAETIGAHADLFSTVDKKHRIFRKKPVEAVPGLSFRASYPVSHVEGGRPAGLESRSDPRAIQQEANRLILDRFSPPAVIVDSSLHVVQFRGHTGHYLEPAPGEASLNLLKMAREGLLYGLRTALHAARKSRRPVRKPALRVKADGLWRTVDLEVVPATLQGGQYYFVFFDEPKSAPPKGRGGRRTASRRREERPQEGARVTRLEQELAGTREYLQSIIQEVEAANEELQSANEEILSSNEELQSTNEELDTAKEELQSTNEELNTVNEELHGRNEELSRVNSDLLNLLSSVQIAIVIVSGDLRIRRFTPMAERMLNLIATDIGRPIVQINPNIDCPDLGALIRRVVEDIVPLERDVQDRDGRWYSLRIRPYKDVDNRIDGAVLTIFDIDFLKRHDEEVLEWRAFADAVIALTDQPLLVIDERRAIRTVTAAFCRTFGCTREQVERQTLARVQDGAWDFPELGRLVDDVLRGVSRMQPVRVVRALPAIGHRPIQLSARRLDTPRGPEAVVLVGVMEEMPAGGSTEGR